MRGTLITKGPQDWQVLQQKNGTADIALEGVWAMENDPRGDAYTRVVREDTGEAVIPWTKAETTDSHDWKITLKDIPAGGLYRVETCYLAEDMPLLEWAARGDMAHHIAVGDLYVIAGQSNSAGYGKDMAYDPPELGVHLLRNCGKWDLATHPMNESTGTVHAANQEGANPGHSPWLAFAKAVKRETGMPVGLVQTSLGGSPLDDWLPGGPLYDNMLGIINAAGGAVAGVLWYQGCSDTNFPKCETYLERFRRFVTATREALGNPALPFLTMQICRHIAEPDNDTDRAWSAVREAQRQAALQIPGVWLITTIDSMMSDMIHVSAASNIVLGERAARTALAECYGKPSPCRFPDIEHAKKTESGVLLTFRNVSQSVYLFEAPVCRLPFRIEDEAGIVPVTGYGIVKCDQVLLKTERAPQGKCTVSSHFGRDPQGVPLIDAGTRLPAPAFHGVPVE